VQTLNKTVLDAETELITVDKQEPQMSHLCLFNFFPGGTTGEAMCSKTEPLGTQALYMSNALLITQPTGSNTFSHRQTWLIILSVPSMTDIHPFHGLFSRTAWVSQQQPDFNEARDDAVAVASAGPYANWLRLTDWAKVLHPTRHKIGHFGDALPSQSLD